jgi:hypothetical protein
MGETDKGKAGAARQQRLSAAMRENLKRRKAQARGRSASEPKPAEGGHEAADSKPTARP